MHFRILGPLEVLDEGRPVALGGNKQRALLAVLLLHANESITADRLIEELWGEEPPPTVAKALQVHVSRLRKALGGDGSGGILTRERGYELAVGPDDVDAHCFERLAAEGREELANGRPDRAVTAFTQALGLWHGTPLSDLAYEPFAQREIPRLAELRIGVVEQLVDAKLALGRHAEVVAELEGLIPQHPFRERLRAQLTPALYRSDRQADALQAFQDARRVLVQDLGIEPGARLRELEQAVLGQDPSLQLVPEQPPRRVETAAPPRGAFVGRDSELALLLGRLDDACAGRGSVVLVAGEPGIGKSRLAEELAAHARDRGARVLVGRCWEAGGAPAYWPWVQSLRAHARATPDAELRRQMGELAADLTQLLPELRGRFPEVPEPLGGDDEGARFRLFEAVTLALEAMAAERPTVLVLDDLHAADEPSLLLLRFVARQIAAAPVLLVCAYRDVDPTVRDPLSWALADLVREEHTSHVALTGLAEEDVADYVRIATGVEPAPQLARAIHAEAEGNPLFVGELVRLLEAEGRLSEPDAHLSIPPGVRAVIGRRIGRLSEPCRTLLIAASVLGREFGLDALARLGGVDRDALLDALDEAMDERVIGEAPGSAGRLRFGHALIRDTLYDELTAARRMRLHERAGEALETVYAADLEPHLAELAHHFAAAAPGGAADRAVVYARLAGDRAAAQIAYEEAVRLYQLALSLTADETVRCGLLLSLGEAEARAGDTPASRQAFRDAADLADRVGRVDDLVRAALGYGGRVLWEVTRDDDRHLRLLERAHAAMDEADSPARVRVLARLAAGPLRDSPCPPARRRQLASEALDMARRLGDDRTLAYALAGYIAAHHNPDFTPEQIVLSTELEEVARRAGDLERLLDAIEHRCTARIEMADVQGGKEDIAEMARLAAELRQPSQRWLGDVYTAVLALLEGRLDEAEEVMERALATGELVHGWNARTAYCLQLYALRRLQGRLDEIADVVHRAAGETPTYPILHCLDVHVAAATGRAAEARQMLDALAAGDFARLTFDEEWLVSVTVLIDACALVGASGHAAELYRRMAPYAGRIAVSYPEVAMGAVSRSLGVAAATAGRWDDADRHFADAIELNERIGAAPWVAETQRGRAEARAQAGLTEST